MTKKQLAEMIKHLRNEKLKEQEEISKAQSKEYLKKQKFNPVHSGPAGDTPNRYAHNIEETLSTTVSSGTGSRHHPRQTVGNISKLFTGRKYEASGNQMRRPHVYGNRFRPVSEEDTEKLGSTDTKRKTQSVTITPEFEPFGKQ